MGQHRIVLPSHRQHWSMDLKSLCIATFVLVPADATYRWHSRDLATAMPHRRIRCMSLWMIHIGSMAPSHDTGIRNNAQRFCAVLPSPALFMLYFISTTLLIRTKYSQFVHNLLQKYRYIRYIKNYALDPGYDMRSSGVTVEESFNITDWWWFARLWHFSSKYIPSVLQCCDILRANEFK